MANMKSASVIRSFFCLFGFIMIVVFPNIDANIAENVKKMIIFAKTKRRISRYTLGSGKPRRSFGAGFFYIISLISPSDFTKVSG